MSRDVQVSHSLLNRVTRKCPTIRDQLFFVPTKVEFVPTSLYVIDVWKKSRRKNVGEKLYVCYACRIFFYWDTRPNITCDYVIGHGYVP